MKAYRIGFDLPIALAIIASYLREEIPPTYIFTGEVDLMGNIRSPERKVVEWIIDLLKITNENKSAYKISKIYISNEIADDLKAMLNEQGILNIEIVGIDTLISILKDLWPNAF